MPPRPGNTRREQLLAIAGRLFAEHGYHGTSIRLVAGAAGLQSATLYGHFESKAAIFREIIVRYFDDLLAALGPVAADAAAPAAARLDAMIRRSVAVGRRHRDGFVALSNNWKYIQATPELADLVGRRNEVSALWLSVVRAGQQAGAIAPGIAPGDLLWLLYAAITGLVDDRYQAVAGAGTEPPVDLLLSVLAGGLGQAVRDLEPTA